jgi:hypothetical protein
VLNELVTPSKRTLKIRSTSTEGSDRRTKPKSATLCCVYIHILDRRMM